MMGLLQKERPHSCHCPAIRMLCGAGIDASRAVLDCRAGDDLTGKGTSPRFLQAEDMFALAKVIKQACGTDGTVKKGVIEIQGENREK